MVRGVVEVARGRVPFGSLVKFIVLVWSGGTIIIVEVCVMSEKGCLVCCPRGEEGRILLYFLRRTLLRLNHDYQPDFTEANESRLLNDHAFTRLLAILPHHHTLHHPQYAPHHTPHCQHFRLGRLKFPYPAIYVEN